MFHRDAPRGTWDFRRSLAVRTLEFCAGYSGLALVLSGWIGPEVAKTAITSAFTLAGAVTATYLGAATTHDYLHRPKPEVPPAKPPVQARDEAIG
jgi:hypothetical protein